MIAKLNTNINIIGGIPDFNMIYDVLYLLSKDVSVETLHNSVIKNNKYGVRTEEARSRFLRVIKSAFWQFENSEHEILIRSLFGREGFSKTKRLALFWMLGVNNPLFEDLSKQVFLKAYFSGRIQIKNDDIIAYLRYIREKNQTIKKWSENTLKTVASKYLTFLKKIDFLIGRQKKEFTYIQADNDSLIYFLYLIKAVAPDQPDILKNRYIDFLFIEKTTLIDILKKAVFADYFNIQTTGIELKIELKHSYGEIIDVISSRAQTKV